jgi:hypothetical protein
MLQEIVLKLPFHSKQTKGYKNDSRNWWRMHSYRHATIVRKTPHIAHKGGSQEVPHVQSLISSLAGQEEKMAQQLLSAGLALSSIWEKARTRDRQREVPGDKGQWGFVLQGMKPAVAQATEWWQGAVLIIPPFFV